MSAPTHVQRCREWIREQIDAMGTLRTANSRDLVFKSWRQNTVTVLQRIWPEDLERVERFRRIVFTPPHSRADIKLAREWFGKGIGESRTYLQSILDIIDREGVPDPSTATDREEDAGTMEDEVGFPILDLDEKADTAEAFDETVSQSDESGLGVTSGYTTPDDQGASPRDQKTPAPPALSTTMRAPTPSELRKLNVRPPVQIPRAPSLTPANEPEEAEQPEPVVEAPGEVEPGEIEQTEIATPKLSSPRPGMTAASKTPAPKPTESAKPAAGPSRPGMSPASKPATPAPRPGMSPAAKASAPAPRPAAKPAEPARPSTQMPRPTTPTPRPATPAAAKPAPTSDERTDSGSRVEARGKNARGKQQKKSGPREKLKDLLGLSQFDSRAHEPEEVAEVAVPIEPAPESVPEPMPAPEPEPAPVAEYAEPESLRSYDDEVMPAEDDEDRERATMDFMQNSPVFGLVGKPVNRRSDTTEFLDPDAVAVATLAADVGRLGVPQAIQASVAARLLDVAKHLEDGALDWALLRGTVTDAMQYPDLAKRLLPILLPWLERAA